MKAVNAIERLEVFLSDVSEGAPELLDDAIRLGIEALKHHREETKWLLPGHPFLLPGETEDYYGKAR